MKSIFEKCRFDRVQNGYIAIGVGIGAAMGAAEGDMGMWLGVGAATGLLFALNRSGRNDKSCRDKVE